MQTEVLPAGVQPEVITLSGGVGVLPPSARRSFLFSDIGPLLATALHEHPRLREMNVQFQQTVRATVIGAGAHTLSCPGAPSGWRGSIAAAQSAGGYPAGCRRSAERGSGR